MDSTPSNEGTKQYIYVYIEEMETVNDTTKHNMTTKSKIIKSDFLPLQISRSNESFALLTF